MSGRWKAHLLTLPDSDFFRLVRLHLGPIKTPFHKQRLIERLAAYVQKDETRRRILALLNEEDARFLTAIDFLDEPPLERLLDFLAQDRSYLEIHHRILNLEERLLIYRDRTGPEPEVRLNPFLADGIRLRAVRPAVLFPSREEQPSNPPLPWLSEGLLLGFLSWMLRRQEVLKSDGTFRRRAIAEIEGIFPSLLLPSPEGTRLYLLKDALVSLGLLRLRDGVLLPDLPAWQEFMEQEAGSRRPMLWAAFASRAALPLETRSRFIAALLTALPGGRAFSVPSLVRMAAAALPGEQIDPETGRRIVVAMASLEILLPAGDPGSVPGDAARNSGRDGGTEEYLRNPHARMDEEQAAEREPPLILQPTFDLTVTPRMPAAEALPIAIAADVRGCDTYTRYELTKGSVARAIREGWDAEGILRHLERLSGKPAPQNVAFSLDIWERELRSLALYRGRVLVVDGELRHLVEHSEELRSSIRKVLAPGVYLLVDEDGEGVRKAFERIGLELPPESDGRTAAHATGSAIGSATGRAAGSGPSSGSGPRSVSEPDTGERTGSSPPRLSGPPSAASAGYSAGQREAGGFLADPEGDLVEQELFSHLDSMQLAPHSREELARRIRSHLVLFPYQLSEGTVHRERREARGLDYLGKVRLIEQVLLSEWDLIELVVRGSRGEPEKMLVKPRQLEKVGSGLFLAGSRMPDQEAVRISVGKIGLVRRIRGSLLGG